MATTDFGISIPEYGFIKDMGYPVRPWNLLNRIDSLETANGAGHRTQDALLKLAGLGLSRNAEIILRVPNPSIHLVNTAQRREVYFDVGKNLSTAPGMQIDSDAVAEFDEKFPRNVKHAPFEDLTLQVVNEIIPDLAGSLTEVHVFPWSLAAMHSVDTQFRVATQYQRNRRNILHTMPLVLSNDLKRALDESNRGL